MKTEVVVGTILNGNAVFKNQLATGGLFNELYIPANFTGTPVCNFYITTPQDYSRIWVDCLVTINCRASTKAAAETLAKSAAVLFDRTRAAYDSREYLFSVTLLQTLPPSESGDLYNCPLQVRVKSNKEMN